MEHSKKGGNDDEQDVAALNHKRREYAHRTGLPYIPVVSDEQAPPVDPELVRKMLDRELPPDEWKRVAGYCWTYLTWIKAVQRIERERNDRRRKLLEESEPSPES